MELFITLLAGAIGGIVVGALYRRGSMGHFLDAAAGIVGGGLGGAILPAFGIGRSLPVDPNAPLGSGAVLGMIAAGLIGGAVVMLLAGIARHALGES